MSASGVHRELLTAVRKQLAAPCYTGADMSKLLGYGERRGAEGNRSTVLIRCGRCGRKLCIVYSVVIVRLRAIIAAAVRSITTPTSVSPSGGLRVDEAVAPTDRSVLTPGAIEAALKSTTNAADKQDELERAIELELEQAEYEAVQRQPFLFVATIIFVGCRQVKKAPCIR